MNILLVKRRNALCNFEDSLFVNPVTYAFYMKFAAETIFCGHTGRVSLVSWAMSTVVSPSCSSL